MKLRVATLAVAASLVVASPAAADTFTVTGFGDGSGSCAPNGPTGIWACTTLRAAVDQASAITGEDTISLGAGEYSVNAGDLELAGSIQIAGAGPRQTTVRSVDSPQPVFTAGGGADVTLALMTIRGGTNGISIVGGAEVGMTFTRVTAATGTAGILNAGTVVVTNSLIDGNNGAGIRNAGIDGQPADVTVGNSTVALNSGAGIASVGTSENNVSLLHATVARNAAAGLSFSSPQDALASGSIIAFNGGGTNCAGGPLTGEHNVEDTTSCALAPGQNQSVTDPRLAATTSDQGGYTDVLAIAAGSPAIDYVNPCVIQIDQRPFTRVPSLSGPCDAGAYELSGTDPGFPQDPPPDPTPTPTPPPQPPTPTPAPGPEPTPAPNQTAVVREVRGTVKVQLPGTKTFVDVDAARGIPMGSTIDTRKGAVELTSVPRAGAPPEKATFYDGLFKVTQRAGITDLALVEELDCGKGKRASASQKGKKPKSRKLWGDGKGAFRTSGRYSAATVRGTKWLVQDTCTTTTVRVTQGSVLVQDKVKKKRIVLRAPKTYVARAKK
ncbi:right-handed parallel beta-helix repeat-containing protein [Solirubrobacter sp. CPCC 204708]|uniref:Right-handed parallel beta-helix repeat-containing protein n=1 Tax=Solirubrobacter deserti TaxID=2282478 RepID=A0ABT4RKJ7_9ACTN|nr:right-handed parallel beta-helix repeat-containing protein [Solirubrobacter deserti]MBE2316810.1 right-handed parallel beta-helix repeat-containing protein [Solirubrobacter deserti]MDA0138973.1 right-handed parallel beta-helix repeat-containing protein [Solirubrobacter deserti]